MDILHRLTFARGSEALEFVRTLRELAEARIQGELVGLGPVVVYGARIVTPDAPAELYASVGALTLTHALGIGAIASAHTEELPSESALPGDMALLFAATTVPDESIGAVSATRSLG